MKTKTTITPKILLRAEELAEKAFNNVSIAQALGLSAQVLSRNKQLKQSIQRGKLKLSESITKTVLNTLEENASTQQLLIKRLCLFNPIIDIKKPLNADDALKNLSTATKLYANSEINESQLKTIEAVSNSFIKGVDVIDLEARITALEERSHA